MSIFKKYKIGIVLFTSLLFLVSCGKENELKDSDSSTSWIHLSEEAQEIRENNLNEFYKNKNYKIHSEVVIGDTILSSVTFSEGIGIYCFENGPDYRYMGIGHAHESDDKITYEFRDMLGNSYVVFWVLDSNIDSVEFTYSTEEKTETLTFDTKEMFYWKIPYEDCTYVANYLDVNGNVIPEKSWDAEYINHRILIDNVMYSNSGVTCEPVPEELISGNVTSAASIYQIPTENGQANFGKYHPYKIEEDHLKIRVYDQWYIFEKLWEIKMDVKDVTREGLTLVCSHIGKGIATSFHTNDSYWLEIKTEEGWEEVPMFAEVQWREEPYFIEKNKNVEYEALQLKVNWEEIYGSIQLGEYRIGKMINWFDEIGNQYVTQNCYAEFTIK